MTAQAYFSRGDVDVTPGSAAVLQLTVVNLSDSTDSFMLSPAGMAAGWTTIRPATVTLFGGSQEVVDIEVHPPLLPSTTAGPTALSVRIVPQSDPDDIVTAETTLVVSGSYDRRLTVLQPAQRGLRGATFEMMLENRGNTQASCRLHLIDPSGRVEGDFDPPAAGVEPGASTLVRMKLRTKGLQWERRSRTIPFRVDADQPGSPTATAQATFVQAPIVGEHIVGRLVAVVSAAALLGAAWFGVVKPAIRDAADDAVRDAAPASTASSNVTVDSATGSSVVTPTVPDPSSQETIVNVPLRAEVAQGQVGDQRYTVPAGKRLRVTDLIVQNPNSDLGTLVVLRNDVPLFTYRLDQQYTDVDQPLITPLELLPGEQLVVSVTCAGVGDPTFPTCAPKVLVSGVLVPA